MTSYQDESLYAVISYKRVYWFLGAFAKFRKRTTNFVMSVCPSVSPHKTTQLPMEELDILVFFETLSKKFKFY